MYIYIHITCINHYQEIIKKMMNKIKESELYGQIKEIRISLIGNKNFQLDDKMKIIYNGSLGEYENKTINLIDVENENEPILYLHSKGVTKPGHLGIQDWTDLLIYYLIEQWKVCIEGLKYYDTVGVNLSIEPKIHYSGNMWWTTMKHLKNIGKLDYQSYLDSEMYVCKKGKHLCLWNSKINHYHQRYPLNLYKSKFEPYQIISPNN
jgi:hypothetical protein